MINKCSEILPTNNKYVLAFFPNKPWIDSSAKNDEHLWVVVQFKVGISKKEREELPGSSERKKLYCSEDEHGNNTVPYRWETFTSTKFFGQEAEFWTDLPII